MAIYSGYVTGKTATGGILTGAQGTATKYLIVTNDKLALG